MFPYVQDEQLKLVNMKKLWKANEITKTYFRCRDKRSASKTFDQNYCQVDYPH